MYKPQFPNSQRPMTAAERLDIFKALKAKQIESLGQSRVSLKPKLIK